MAKLQKIDSNNTGLRFCEELTLGALPVASSQVWYPMEPNSYSSYGQQVKTVARTPINAGRQRKKGTTVDVDASGGFQTDLTATNLLRLLQGFFFADAHEKTTTAPITGAAGVVITGAGAHTYTAASGLTIFASGDLIAASGMSNPANNGLRHVTGSASGSVTVSETNVVESSTTGVVSKVGIKAGSGDIGIVNSGTAFPTMTSSSLDFTTLGLLPGEWIFIGGDVSGSFFATAVDNGFARVRTVAVHLITFDKTAGEMVTDTGSGKTIEIYLGRVFRNEQGTAIKRRTYTLERILGANNTTDLTKQQAEYQVGAVANEFQLDIKAADKITAELSYMSLHEDFLDENVSGANTLYSKQSGATAPSLLDVDCFNTSTDVPRVNLAIVSTTDAFPTPLFAYCQDIQIMIKNNLKGAKAVGVIGSFEVTSGYFDVSGKLTAYFADVAGVTAIRNNADVTMDVHMVHANAGMSIDIPVVTLGDGRLDVKQNEPIMLPLSQDAGAGTKVDPTLNYTALVMSWDYLPTLAQ